MTQEAPTPSPTAGRRDLDVETLREMYQPLVGAAVSTRRDLDQIAFRYIASLTTIAIAIASDTVELSSRGVKGAAALIVLVIVLVAVLSLLSRNKVYKAINHTLINIELGLGGTEVGRYVPGRAVFDVEQWHERSTYVVFGQVVPHLVAVPLIGLVCIATIIADATV